ncbi:hypothetical protein B0H12DRAFT_1085083, partial [Mycena haematopus]
TGDDRPALGPVSNLLLESHTDASSTAYRAQSISLGGLSGGVERLWSPPTLTKVW